MEVHEDAIAPSEKILLVDDLLATGGTAAAAAQLVRELSGVVQHACFLVDLPDLGGRKLLEKMGLAVHTLSEFGGS